MADIIDRSVFDQVLSMDDEGDETREFSRSLVESFCTQAEETFIKMKSLLYDNSLQIALFNIPRDKGEMYELGRLGHFLKGSSAALGITQLRACCERVQYFGDLKDPANHEQTVTKDHASLEIGKLLIKAQEEYMRARQFFHDFYKIQQA